MLETHPIHDILKNAGKSGAPPSLWFETHFISECADTQPYIIVGCKEYPYKVNVYLYNGAVVVGDIVLSKTFTDKNNFQGVIEYVWRRLEKTAEEIIAEDKRDKQIKAEKEAQMAAREKK